MKKRDIDTIFSEGLKDFAPSPNPQVWQTVANKIIAKKQKKRLIIFWTTGVAAVILLLLSLAIPQLWHDANYNANNNSLAVSTEHSNQQQIVPKDTFYQQQTESKQNSSIKKESNKINYSAIKNSKNIKPRIINISNNKFRKNDVLYRKTAVQQITKVTKIRNSTISSKQYTHQIAPLKKMIAKRCAVLHSEASPFYLQIRDNEFSERNLIAYNLINQLKNNENPSLKWAVIGQISTAYSSEKSANKSGIVNIGGSIKVNFKVSKKLALQTGIAFNRYGQSYGSRNNIFMGMDKSEALLNGAVNAIPTVTPAGKITATNSPKSYMADKIDAGAFNSFNYLPENIEQHFDYIELPLLLRYNITEQQFGLFVIGGFGFNYLVGNSVYSTDNNQKIGTIEGLRTTNIISQLGIGVEYRLSPKVKIGIEPTFKYHINSLNHQKAYNYKPYSIGLQTGVRIDF